MRRMLWILVGLSTFALAGLAQAQPSQPDFEEGACPFEVPAGADVRCGFVSVPEDRADPANDNRVRLAVAVFAAAGADAHPDPVMMLAGGPGEPAVMTATAILPMFAQVNQQRDFVVFDQRGAGLSQPSLACPEISALTRQTAAQNLTPLEAGALTSEALLACGERLTAEGVTLEAYNSAQSAADVADVAAALGYERVNLWGGSYGGRMAQTVMRDFPQLVRSAVIDSPIPIAINYVAAQGAKTQRVLDLLFEQCAAQVDCAAAYPDLEGAFYGLVEQLNATPITLVLTDPATGEPMDYVVNGDTFVGQVFVSFFLPGAVARLPQTIDDIRAGDYSYLERISGFSVLLADTINIGLLYAVNCPEEVAFASAEDFSAEIAAYPQIGGYVATSFLGGGEQVVAACAAFTGYTADARETERVSSDIPALVMSGEWDQATPPEWGRLVASTLSNSFYYALPGLQHVVTGQSECAQAIVAEFIDDPTREPAAANCAADLPPVTFATPGRGVPRITPIEYSDAGAGFTTLVPDGWQEAAPGVFLESAASGIVLVAQAAPGTASLVTSALAGQFGLDAWPAPIDTRAAGSLTWTLYFLEVQGQGAHVALAEAAGMTYIVILQGPGDDASPYVDTVYYPALDAFTIGR